MAYGSDLALSELNRAYQNRERGHYRVDGAGYKAASGKPVVRLDPSQELLHRDSWKGHGPFAEMARSIIMEGGAGDRQSNRGGAGMFDEQLYSSESRTNLATGFTMRIKPLKAGVPGIERGQLGFLKQHDPTQIVDSIDCDGGVPQIVLPFSAWQAYMHRKQKELWLKDNGVAYRRQTPIQFIKDWVLIGALEEDDMPMGHVVDRPRVCTMLVKNQAPVKTYWRKARPGSRVYVVIKKYGRDGPIYNMAERPENDGIELPPTIGPMRRDVDIDEEEDEDVEAMDQTVPITPYSIGFYCATQGEPLPIDVWEYQDEDGFTHYDAVVIDCGTVLSTPMGAAYNREMPQNQICEIFTEDMERQRIDEYTPMKILLDINYNK